MPGVVLIVEDSGFCAATLQAALLGIPGVSVYHFPTAEQALRFLDAGITAVSAVITDLQLPSMDGFELIRRIRADRGLPIVVISGDTDPETPERVRRLGADAFFPKPFSPAEVRNKLEQLLNASSA